MENTSHILALLTLGAICISSYLLYTKSPYLALLKATRTQVSLAVFIGLVGGFLIAYPQSFINIAVYTTPLLLLSFYILLTIRLIRGLKPLEGAILLAFIIGGISYYVAKRDYNQALFFGIGYGALLALSTATHALLRKYHNAAFLTSLRRTRFYRILRTSL